LEWSGDFCFAASTSKEHLLKDSKTKDGCIEPMHCRPITILSVFWRVWVSAWLKKRTTTEWIKTVLHTEVPYGNQMDAANAAGDILEAYAKDKHQML